MVIKEQLTAYFESNSIFSTAQYGFRRNFSTVDALEKFISSIISGFDEHKSTLTILCDLSKAFDCVSHTILINKLQYYGITGKELDLFISYLSGRTQSVCFMGQFSEFSNIDCGVPQGSVLGPLLFLIMVNDLSFNVNCESIQFADDTSLYMSSCNIMDLNNFMANSLEQATMWFEANGFTMNISKTQQLLFTLKNIRPNDMSSHEKLLGIYLDTNLTWTEHINFICIRLSRVIYLLRHLRKTISKVYLKSAYYGFFHSILVCSYGEIQVM